MNVQRKRVCYINGIIALLATVMLPTFVSDDSLSFSNSFFSVVWLIMIYAVLQYSHEDTKDSRLFMYTHIAGLIFSNMIYIGHSLDAAGSISFSGGYC